jgi:hypothetical protein
MAFRAEPYVLDLANLTDDGPGNLGLALATGRLVATVVSKKTGKHISVQLQAKRKEGKRFRACEFHAAERIYADVPREGGTTGAEIGALHLVGKWAGNIMPPWEVEFDPARLWAMKRVLDVAQDLEPIDDEKAYVLEGKTCLMCGRELTDPESITRNIGPECWSNATSLFASRGEHAAPREADVFVDGSAEDVNLTPEEERWDREMQTAATGYQVPDGASADEALEALAGQGFVAELEHAGQEVRREATRQEIEAELQSTVKTPREEEAPDELEGPADEVGDLYPLGAGDDPRELLRQVTSDA